ncbi:Peptidylglycine alpha-hydroxylating monooxygenase [Orchesella cincta]|uniref:peptidylglycine monooxygenase n=1 Tax=Orchesella cincta TaxID=48709 RepID=A0A1D2NN17_ORCCI|nr:Peptidylglycine alpha-hydroxylating monooxygenase [Orchesella cincta]
MRSTVVKALSMKFFSWHAVLVLLFELSAVLSLETESYSILMPNVAPKKPETYLCTPVRVDPTTKHYVVGFSPNATMHVAHHMLLFGCTTPGSSEEIWDCGEMATSRQQGLKRASACSKGSQIIYAWARDAPDLELPKDVAFEVGGDSKIQYLVLQVHYADVSAFENGHTDESGVALHYTDVPQPKAAGVFLLGTNGYIAGKTTEYMETACAINENKVMHPFAFRTHTHSLGRVVSGYRVRRDHRGIDEWTLIGKKNPMKPQMFYPVSNNLTVVKGDVLAARCTMVSDRSRITKVGPTNEDEMCNFYVMYWVEGSQPLNQKYCFTMGPPFYYWDRGFPFLNNIPSKDASSI